MNNISLRCDVNYDHDLHFMPIAGKRGEEKRENARKYWLALTAELRIYLHNIQHCQQCNSVGFSHQQEFPQRLPDMFENLRLLLESLVPERDHDQVAENVDVAFLMQQVQHGVFDAARMSSWLAKLLKTHCAPMRDEWADTMSRKIEEGATDVSMLPLVAGLEKLFSFLEAMKLVSWFFNLQGRLLLTTTGCCQPSNSYTQVLPHRGHCFVSKAVLSETDR